MAPVTALAGGAAAGRRCSRLSRLGRARRTLRRLAGDRQRLRAYARGRFNRGQCAVCGSVTTFVRTSAYLREGYRCSRCGSKPRHRALQLALDQACPAWADATMLLCGTHGPQAGRLRRDCRDLIQSDFRPGAAPGEVLSGVRNEDLESLTLSDRSVDVVVSLDVFEHVLRPRQAFSEVARVLRPGGAHVFTVPYSSARPVSLVRAVPDGAGGITHLEAPEYHRNPMDPAGSLVVTEWGSDLPFVIFECSHLATTVHLTRDRRLGLDGDHLEAFVSRKAPAP